MIGTETAAGERLGRDPTSPLWGDHRSRYHFASRFVDRCVVLDIACGTGLGADILLDGGAVAVVGVDISKAALVDAQRVVPDHYELVRADGTRLPFVTASFTAITSFETLEHVHEPDSFLSELSRMLAPGACLVLSTPNALYTRPVNGKPRNPFHVQEFTPDELRELLSRHFSQVELFGQRTDERFRACPFWNLPATLPTDLRGRLEVLSYKLQGRLPRSTRERISRLLYRRSFYPGENDFVFTAPDTDRGHVLVAVARR